MFEDSLCAWFDGREFVRQNLKEEFHALGDEHVFDSRLIDMGARILRVSTFHIDDDKNILPPSDNNEIFCQRLFFVENYGKMNGLLVAYQPTPNEREALPPIIGVARRPGYDFYGLSLRIDIVEGIINLEKYMAVVAKQALVPEGFHIMPSVGKRRISLEATNLLPYGKIKWPGPEVPNCSKVCIVDGEKPPAP